MKRLLFTVTFAAFAAASVAAPASADSAAGEKISAFREKARKLVSQMTLEEKRQQVVNSTQGIGRLGLQRYSWWNEALHGIARNGRATVFPEPIGQAASFNPDLVKKVAEAIVDEGRAKYAASLRLRRIDSNTGLTYWSPNVNIFRDPRWGRGMETWGEDPFLTGVLGSAFVRGIQGDDPVYYKATACAKHYAVHSGPESKRHSFNVNPSKKDLWETYLPAFEMLIRDAGVQSVMSAYNAVYGESATSSEFLLKDVLRKKWGFKGIVVSDCGAVSDIRGGHHLEKDREGSSARALNNGLTYECGGDMQALEGAVKRGLVKEEVIDAAIVDMLVTRYRLGIMEDDPECPYSTRDESNLCTPEHEALAREIARESMVLLKNDGVLPIDLSKKQRRIAINGSIAFDAFSLMGNYYGFGPHLTTYIEGISSALDAGNGMEYCPGYYYGQQKGARTHWAGGDVAIAFVGNVPLFEGEEGDAIGSAAGGDRKTLALPEIQLEMLRRLKDSKASYAKIVTVVSGGSPIALKEVMEMSDAVIFAWYPGQEGGHALADLLFGKADFTGRLPITFPVDESVLPDFEDYSMAGRTYRYQTEGVFLPFGYGLSLGGTPAYDRVVLSQDRRSASVTLTNKGRRDTVETVQLYVATPNAGKGAPISSLAGFARVSVPAGKTVTANVSISNRYAFTEVDEDGRRVRPAGTYRVIASAAAPGARSAELGVPSCETSVELRK